ncbi:hypothetical protein [Streptomyces chrestomyceticus]|uniref:hypothetical protein n=1 Tax=Streptomyces chrestomyceticus TaxID=68185 RepID=UPI003F4CC6ED
MLSSTICTVVSVAGLGIAALTAYRKRFLAATRVAAFSLVPVGLAMTGVIDWLTGVVFKPVVWAGFGVLALSVVLFMIARMAERHSLKAGGGRKERRAGGGLLRHRGHPEEARHLNERGTVRGRTAAGPRKRRTAGTARSPRVTSRTP